LALYRSDLRLTENSVLSNYFGKKPVNLERTQYIGHYGVTLSVIRSTVKPNGKQALSDLISRKPCNLHSADIIIGLDAQRAVHRPSALKHLNARVFK